MNLLKTEPTALFIYRTDFSLWIGTFLGFLSLFCTVHADIRSTTDIVFDVNDDLVNEAILNSTGLGIGVTPSSNLHVAGNSSITQKLTIGSSTLSSSNLYINGRMSIGTATVSSDSTLSASSLYFANSASSNLRLELPYSGNVTGRTITIKKTSHLNTVWIGGGGNLIDSSSEITMGNTDSNSLPYLKVISNGSSWASLSSNDCTSSIAAGNLVLHYTLDEDSGTVVNDSSGYDKHASLANLTFSANSVAGVIGNGLEKKNNGTNAGVNNGPELNAVISGNTLSISFWIKSLGSNNDFWISYVYWTDGSQG
ncbi:MAG: hypothetical protein HQL32_18370, partial [Planctomycetes bacterium]|nr:hypothetical protein [Planctomycetota bacterium]